MKPEIENDTINLFDTMLWARTIADLYLKKSHHQANLNKKDLMAIMDHLFELNKILEKVNNL